MPARAEKCAGIRGIIEEGKEHLQEHAYDAVMDAILVGAAQKAEHYESRRTGRSARTRARSAATRSRQCWRRRSRKKKEADKKLSDIAESFINAQAAEGDETGDEEEEDEGEVTFLASGFRSALGPVAISRV